MNQTATATKFIFFRSAEGHLVGTYRGTERFAVTEEPDGFRVWENDVLVGWCRGLRVHTQLEDALREVREIAGRGWEVQLDG